MNNTGWKAMIEQKVSRGRLSAAFGADGFVKKMWEPFAIKKSLPRKFVVRRNESGAVGDKQKLAQ